MTGQHDGRPYDMPYERGFDNEVTPFQRGYLCGAYDKAHWVGEEKSHDCYEDEEPIYSVGYWDGWNNTQPLDEEYINDARNWHEWLEEYEYDIPDDALTINRLFTEYEQTIAELRRQLRSVQGERDEWMFKAVECSKELEVIRNGGY